MPIHRRYSAHPSPSDFRHSRSAAGKRLPQFRVDTDEAMVASLFIGPRAENGALFKRLVDEAIETVTNYRQSYLPGDPEAITAEIRDQPTYQTAVRRLEERFGDLLQLLNEHATPYFASRYQGHMLWDTLMPGMLGYFATMLHNPNNVTVQASTLTTFLELMVGWDLCTMLGLPFKGRTPWGHITADGSVANLEAVWSARELKFFPLAAQSVLADLVAARNAEPAKLEKQDPLGFKLAAIADQVSITTLKGEARLLAADAWTLLNVPMSGALELPTHIVVLMDEPGVKEDQLWPRLLAGGVATVGLVEFYRRSMGTVRHQPVLLAPATKHYSWPKALSVTGSGSGTGNVIDIAVDVDARLDIDDLRRKLDKRLAMRQPVLLTVAVMGSTEEGACDPLGDVLQVREDYRRLGLDFNVHADGAWGGYITSVMRKDFAQPGEGCDAPWIEDQSRVHLNAHTRQHLSRIADADSVTIDPHKMGYIQYPAGALCYADERLRNLVTFGAPVIGAPGSQVSVGEFGIEGSKPGAAPAAVYLVHAVLRPSVSGYGQLINAALRSAKAFYLRVFALAEVDDPFIVVPLARLPSERQGSGWHDQAWPLLVGRMAEMAIDDIMADPELSRHFNEIGPDQNIVDYTFNFKCANGALNRSIEHCNALNAAVYDAFHVHEGKVEGLKIDFGGNVQEVPLIISQTEMSVGDYGEPFMRDYAARLGLDLPSPGEDFKLKVNRTVVMDPWLSRIEKDGRPFLDVIFAIMRDEVTRRALAAASSPAGRLPAG